MKSSTQVIGEDVNASTVQQLDAYIGQIKDWLMQIDSRWSCTEIPGTFTYDDFEVPVTIRKLIWNNCNDTELVLQCLVYSYVGLYPITLAMMLQYHTITRYICTVRTAMYSGPLYYVVGDNWFVMHTMGSGPGSAQQPFKSFAIGALIGDDGITRCFWQSESSTGMYKNGIREYPFKVNATNSNMYIDGYLYDGSSTLTTKISNGVCVGRANVGVEYTIDGKLYYTIPVKSTDSYYTLLLS
jgi:hypothetical protein